MLSKELRRISKNVKSIDISSLPSGRDYYPFFYLAILLGAVFFMSSGFETITVDANAIKERAIKAVDPMEYFRESDTHKDFATF